MAVTIDGTNGITTPGEVNTANGSVAGDLTVTGALQSSGVATNLYPLVSGTAVSASGTAVDFTGIPSWVRRITVMLNGVSTNGTSQYLVRIGTTSGIDATSYSGTVANLVSAGASYLANSTGFGVVGTSTAAQTIMGVITLSRIDPLSNIWVCAVTGAYTNSAVSIAGGGVKTLSAALDRVRITTVNGTDTFDAGTINILYE